MRKIINIETVINCGWCLFRRDFFDRESGKDKYRCYKTKRIIKNIRQFPSWCPLEDYKVEGREIE